jgi:hypothetical protein
VESRSGERWLGLAAVIGALVGVLYFPFHALAYFATEDGGESEGAIGWADGTRDILEPLLDWDSVDTVYRTWGKVGLVAVVGLALGLLALWRRRRREATGLERWGLRIALVGHALLVVGFFTEYWTPYLDFGFMAFTGPGMIVTMIGSTLLGIGLLRRKAAPRVPSWLLALAIPLVLAMVALFGHISAGLVPLEVAWIMLGLWFGATATAVEPATT